MRTNNRGFGRDGRPPFDVPSERSTRRDRLVVGVVALVVILVAAIALFTGSAARSDLRPAGADQPTYGPSTVEPTRLGALWSHPSTGSGAPLITKGNLVTVDDGGTLIGRDAGSGEERWSYSHAGDLCAAAFYSDSLVTVHDGAAGCSDVTALDPVTQQYKGTRQSAFSDSMELRNTWGHAMAFSPERVEIWRNDLVRTVEYGAVAAPQESGMQPRTGCTLASADLVDERFAVTERCPGDESERLTISKTVPKDNRKPEDIASDVTGADGLWVIDVSAEGVLALADRSGTWAVEWFTSPKEHRTVLELDGAPATRPSAENTAGDNIQVRWFDGAATHAFEVASGAHSWTAEGTTGPGLTGGFALGPEVRPSYDWVLVPTTGGFSVLRHTDGRETHRMRVSLPATEGVVGVAQIGDVLYERRGDTIHAYKING